METLALTQVSNASFRLFNPDDTTRVLLQRDEKKNQSDYINASYVKVSNRIYHRFLCEDE